LQLFDSNNNSEEEKMDGTCFGNQLDSGQQRSQGSYLWYVALSPLYSLYNLFLVVWFGIALYLFVLFIFFTSPNTLLLCTTFIYYGTNSTITQHNSYQTSNTTTYKFGINTSNQLSYYSNDIKLWYALIPPPSNDETNADNTMSSSFVNPSSSQEEQQQPQEEVYFFRINQSGSIAAYNINRLKIWDSHLNLGVYTQEGDEEVGVSNMVNEKISGSILQITENGNVVIQSENDESDDEVVVTWSINAPLEEEEVSVSGMIFYDVNSNGLNDDSSLSSSSSSISIEKGEVVSNVIVDLYDCSSSTTTNTKEDEWILVTRTNSIGEYKFTLPNNIEDDESNLSSYLKERDISKIRAKFTLPSSSTDGGDISYSFSPTSKDSDVNNIGSTSCWDLNNNEKNDIIVTWNAGIITTTSTSQEQSTTPQEEVETTMPTTQETTGTGIVGGYAFLDINNDGIRNNNNDPNSSFLEGGVESSMSNVNIQLYKCTPEEEVSSSSSSFFSGGGETSSTSTTTNNDELLAVTNTNTQGLYTFLNLLQGNYRIKVSPITGYTTSSSFTTNDGIDNTIDPTTWSTICFTLDNGVTDLSWDVGLVKLLPDANAEEEQPPAAVSPSTVTISGLVFQDTNNNGIFDQQQQANEEEEYALVDVQVALFDCSGKIIYITTSDDNGMYGFEDIPTPASYYVKFSPPIGYEISSFWTGGGIADGEGALSTLNNHAHPDHGRTECVEYTGNDDEYALDAGFVPNSEGITFDRPTPSPTSRGTFKGDGTACSGSKCPLAGMCRNQSGLCGVGITFCNPNNVWDSTCPEKDVVTASPVTSPMSSPSTSSPTMSSHPSFTPSLSYHPTQSNEPTTLQFTPKVSICNKDGSYGVTNDNNNNLVQPTEVSFTYALKSSNGLSPTIDMITQVEEDLARRLACIYFPNASCILCDEQQRTLLSMDGRRGMVEENAKERDSNVMLGITSWPIDVPSPVEVCTGSSNSDCRVINGKVQAYFPKNMSSNRIEEERSLLLRNIEYEMDKNDWPGGMQVSYDNGPFPQVNAAEGGNNSSEGLSGGAVAGIIVALLAIVAISSILFIRTKREKDEQQDLFDRQQQAAGAVPYGSEDHDRSYMTGSFGDHEYESDSESDDSSRSDDSESSGSLSFTRSIGKASAVSGDTFPTVTAQARPQDIEDDGAYSSASQSDEEGVSEEDDDESFSSSVGSSEPNLIPPQAEQTDHEYNILRRLQQSSASDDHAAVYEDRLSSGEAGMNSSFGEQQEGRHYYEDDSGNYVVQHQQEGDYDDGNYPVQEDLGGYQDEQSIYPPQKYTQQSQNEPSHVDQIDDTISLNSADPPGQSYRDLPQPDDYWDHTQPPPNQQQPMMHHGNLDMGYMDDTDSHAFQVYESERGLNDSYSSSSVHYNNGDGIDTHSNPGSHHSNQSHEFDSSNRSHHSQGSRPSIHSQEGSSRPSIHSQEGSSRRSIHSQGSRHSIHSQGSHHSRHSQGSQENVQYHHNQPPEHYDQYDQGQYVNDGTNQFNNNSHQVYTDVSQEYTEEEGHYDNHNQGGQGLPPPPLFNGSDYHPQQQYNGGSNNMGHESYHGQYRNGNIPEMTNQYHQNSNIQQHNSGAPYEQYSQEGGRVNDVFDEGNYHSFHPIIPPPPSNHHRPEELDEVSTTGSAYTAKTQQMSNTTSSNDNDGHQLPQNPYDGGGEGENIANVFKSLSEIQSRLANNKKQHPHSEYQMPEQAVPQDDLRGSNNRDDSDDLYPVAMHHHSNGSSNGWGKEGVVEDVSMDGSQMNNLNSNPTRNRIPQQGQWMEPVDED